MFSRIVQRKRAIEMRSTFCEFSREQQGRAHDAMPEHQRDGRPSLLGEFQEPRCYVATGIAVERK